MVPMSCSVAMSYPKYVSFIVFLTDFCIYDDIILDTTVKNSLHFKLSKSGQVYIRPVFLDPVTNSIFKLYFAAVEPDPNLHLTTQ